MLIGARAVKSLGEERDGLGIAPSVFVALVGGLVAVQFHYITMDTGPMLAVLVSLMAAEEAQSNPAVKVPAPGYLRAAFVAGVALYSVATLALGLVMADAQARQGSAAAKSEVPWSIAAKHLRRAAALAPWEPQMRRAEGTAATVRVVKRNEPQVLADGIAAFDDVLKATPGDLIVAAERANLLLAVGVRTNDPKLLEQAAKGFAYVAERDPNTGIPRAGKATALLALGRPRMQ